VSVSKSVCGRLALALLLAGPFASLRSMGQDSNQSPADREAFRAAVETCATENGITLPARPADRSGPRPERPSEADRQVIDACLKAKGIEVPVRKHHGPRECNEEKSETSTVPANE
jgi:hypothetical protein